MTHNAMRTWSRTLRLQDIIDAANELAALPKPIVGIVCRPDYLARIREMAAGTAHPLFGAIPVYEKRGQLEEFITFHDRDEMLRHLSQ